ncbi:MAG: hypothetical protein HDT26_07210 [Subdoligranulum sp.]|nr:hypothetical protein [Subdoligranulum sp.]
MRNLREICSTRCFQYAAGMRLEINSESPDSRISSGKAKNLYQKDRESPSILFVNTFALPPNYNSTARRDAQETGFRLFAFSPFFRCFFERGMCPSVSGRFKNKASAIPKELYPKSVLIFAASYDRIAGKAADRDLPGPQ